MTAQPTWDLKSLPTAKLLDMLHEYSQAHALVNDKKTYEHPDSAHYSAHFYNMRWAVARELEKRGYKFNLLPLVAKSLSDTLHLLPHRPPVDHAYLLAKGLGPGERWITVHPHGDNEPGIPVLIRETPDGVGHIIGGAGGSLNFVKLTNLKSPAEYREHAKKKNAERRQAEKERLLSMSPEERQAEQDAKAKVEEDKRAQEDAEVAKVYKMMGYEAPTPRDPEQLAKENNISVSAAKMALSRERQAHIAAVHQLASALRETLIDDHELAAEAGLGDISLKAASDQELWGTGKVSMDLLQPKKATETSGIKADFTGRAAGSGATKESMGEEGKLVKERAKQGQDAEQRQFTDRISENLKNWNEQAKQLEATGQVKQNVMKIADLPEPGKMLDILKADRALSQAKINAQQAKQDVKRGVQTSPYVVETSEAVDQQIIKQFTQEAELKAVRAMLSRVEEEKGLTRHVRNAAFDTLNEVGLTLAGSELMGREVVDFLGSAGAAQLLAQRLKNTLSDEDFESVATAVSEMHGRENAAKAQEAMQAADEEMNLARQLEASEAEEPLDVIAARALNEQRMEHIDNARTILGDSYGRLMAMGELSLALKGAQKGDKEITCDMGACPRQQAITMARSFGLNPEVNEGDKELAEEAGIDLAKVGGGENGDYRIESGSGRTFITLKPQALAKVVSAFDPADTTAYAEAQQVKQGAEDQDDWLPTGIEKRPASTFNASDYEAGRFDERLELSPAMDAGEVKQAVRDYIGARVGNGYPFDALRSDMATEEFRREFVSKHGHDQTYDRIYGEEFPKIDRQGLDPKAHQEQQAQADKAAEEQARQYSEDYKRRRGLTDDTLLALHTQRLPIREAPEQFTEAAHRTLAGMPEATVAFTPLGELGHEDRDTLRNFYLKEFGKPKPRTEQEEKLYQRQQAREAAEAAKPKVEQPQAETQSMFGDEDIDANAKIPLADNAKEALARQGLSEEQIHAENAARLKQQQVAEAKAAGTYEAGPDNRTPEQKAWDNYCTAMGGQQDAYETLQGIIRGRAVEQFADHYGKVFGRPLKVGREELPNWDKHVTGLLPEDKLKQVMGDRAAVAQSHYAKLASRAGGKFAKEEEPGSRKKAYEALQQMMKSDQGKFFMGEQFPSMDRPTIGQDAEAQLKAHWGNVAENFSAKKGKVDLIPDLSMSGDKIKQQRAVKLALKTQRLGLHMGAGSGKSLVSIGTFTEAHAQGKATKAVFAVPSAVQGQFGSEMLRFTTPGKYNWLSDPKATREERMAAYADDTTHMIVATHHAFRDDLMHAVAQHTGKTPEQIAQAFKTLAPEHRRAAMKAAMDHLGWKVDFAAVDEAHGLLNRQGKPDSSMANAVDAFTYHMPHYLSMTGTPVKNDASEAFDSLAKLDPHRFTDRESFMRKYGVNTPTNHAALQRLMGRYTYADRIASGVERFTDERKVPLHPEQQKEYNAVMSALNKVRRTRRSGKADIEAVKVLAPNAFEDQPEAAHQGIANEVAKVGLGGRLNARLLGIVNGSTYENNAKIDAMREDLQRDKDKPHVIFAHHYQSIDHIKRLCGELGMRVGVISGQMSAAEKAKVRLGFQPGEGGTPKYDVLLNTDAGSTGQNLQRGSVLLNYDTPDTAMTHEQRCARVDRIGQTQDVTVRDYVTDTPIERAARKRLATKRELADVFQSPSELLDDTGLAAEIQRVRAEKGNQPQSQQQAVGQGDVALKTPADLDRERRAAAPKQEQPQEQPQAPEQQEQPAPQPAAVPKEPAAQDVAPASQGPGEDADVHGPLGRPKQPAPQSQPAAEPARQPAPEVQAEQARQQQYAASPDQRAAREQQQKDDHAAWKRGNAAAAAQGPGEHADLRDELHGRLERAEGMKPGIAAANRHEWKSKVAAKLHERGVDHHEARGMVDHWHDEFKAGKTAPAPEAAPEKPAETEGATKLRARMAAAKQPKLMVPKREDAAPPPQQTQQTQQTQEPTEEEKTANREGLKQQKRLERAKRGPKSVAMGYGSIDGDRVNTLTNPQEDRETWEQGTAKIKETARQDREHQEAQESPRQTALREHQIAATQLESLKAAHADSLQSMEGERQRTGSVSKETQDAHRQLQQRVVDAEERATKLRPAARQAELEGGQERHAADKKDQAKQKRDEQQSRKKATEESNFNHMLNQAKTQGKVTDETEPEIRQIADAVGKVNPKEDRLRHLAHALAFGSVDKIKEAAAGQGDLVKNEPRFQAYAQQILDRMAKQKVTKSLRLMVRKHS